MRRCASPPGDRSPACGRHRLAFAQLWLVCTLLLSACAAPRSRDIPFIPLPASPTAARPIVSATLYTEVPQPTQTPTAAPTRQSTFASTTPTAANTPQSVELSFGGFLSGWRYFITFVFSEDVQGEYRAVVDGNKDYTCEVRPESPRRLYCTGPLTAVSAWAPVDLYTLDEAAGGEPVFSGQFFVPAME